MLGHIVAVYYVQDYYIGQILTIKDKGEIVEVDFLESAGKRLGWRLFRWPVPRRLKEVPSVCVFLSDLLITPVSAGGRACQVEGPELQAYYEAFMDYLQKEEDGDNSQQ